MLLHRPNSNGSICCGVVVDSLYKKLYNKSTSSWSAHSFIMCGSICWIYKHWLHKIHNKTEYTNSTVCYYCYCRWMQAMNKHWLNGSTFHRLDLDQSKVLLVSKMPERPATWIQLPSRFWQFRFCSFILQNLLSITTYTCIIIADVHTKHLNGYFQVYLGWLVSKEASELLWWYFFYKQYNNV